MSVSFKKMLKGIKISKGLKDVKGRTSPSRSTPSGVYEVTGTFSVSKVDPENGRIVLGFEGTSTKNTRGEKTTVAFFQGIRTDVPEDRAWQIDSDWECVVGIIENGDWGSSKTANKLKKLQEAVEDIETLAAFLDAFCGTEVTSVISIYNDSRGYKAWVSYGTEVDAEVASLDDMVSDDEAREMRAAAKEAALMRRAARLDDDDDDNYED